MKGGTKIPDWKIDAIYAMYQDGKDLSDIANELGIGNTTVGRYCKGLKRKPLTKITNGKRSELLRSWMCAK